MASKEMYLLFFGDRPAPVFSPLFLGSLAYLGNNMFFLVASFRMGTSQLAFFLPFETKRLCKRCCVARINRSLFN